MQVDEASTDEGISNGNSENDVEDLNQEELNQQYSQSKTEPDATNPSSDQSLSGQVDTNEQGTSSNIDSKASDVSNGRPNSADTNNGPIEREPGPIATMKQPITKTSDKIPSTFIAPPNVKIWPISDFALRDGDLRDFNDAKTKSYVHIVRINNDDPSRWDIQVALHKTGVKSATAMWLIPAIPDPDPKDVHLRDENFKTTSKALQYAEAVITEKFLE